MSDYLQKAQVVAAIAYKVLLGYAVLKTVHYFTSKDKSSEAEIHMQWNTGCNILIGHTSSNTSILKSFVTEEDQMINESTFNKVDRRFREIKKEFGADAEVHLHLRTPGGDLFFALLIAHIVNDWKGKVVAHIHSYSASGGSIIALACQEIHMDSLSVLGPIDPQVPTTSSHYSLTGYLSSIGIDLESINEHFDTSPFLLQPSGLHEYKESSATDAPPDNKKVFSPQKFEKTLEINMRTANSIDLLRTYKKFLERMLLRNYDVDQTKQIIKFFWIGRDHSSPIWREECEKIGVNVVFVE